MKAAVAIHVATERKTLRSHRPHPISLPIGCYGPGQPLQCFVTKGIKAMGGKDLYYKRWESGQLARAGWYEEGGMNQH